MEDPTIRAAAPGRLLRGCQRSRLERQIMSEAYECLVPILKCRCGMPGGGSDAWPGVSATGDEQVAKAGCAGGGR